MTDRRIATIDANEAVASVAFRVNEVMAIYPITPSSPMGESSDEWASRGQKNIWDVVPDVVEMQSEAGAAGSVHGALQAGALTSTFTASQGLLLMIPNMYKIAGELTPFTMHVSARTLATHALSIFGDHSDVMACRQTGFAMLCSNSVQEAHDLACIAQMATLDSRIPFLHFFDGFRTSHEVAKIELMADEDLKALIDDEKIAEFRSRALTPDRPRIGGTAQNPDVFFQAQEAGNPFHLACPDAVQKAMDQFAKQVGRQYKLFDYVGAPDAEKVIICMGSGAETAHETIEYLVGQGEKVGMVKVRLFRPFKIDALLEAIPATTKAIAVLDRCKEPGAMGEPLYMDTLGAIYESRVAGTCKLAADLKIIGGRYGISSKEFTPAMVKGVFDELGKVDSKNHFTVGIVDDVTNTSIDYDDSFDIEPDSVNRCMFFGLGADGTVGANKNSIKIIGEGTDNFAQGYFVYDSKKSGAMTTSHLRFGPSEIRSAYLIRSAGFVACHQPQFLDNPMLLDYAAEGATFLLNTPFGKDEVWAGLPKEIQEAIIEKKLKFYVIDAYKVAGETGMGQRINTIMQTCFFAISGVLPKDEAIAKIKEAIKKTYGKRGEEIVKRNYAAVDGSLEHLHEVDVPAAVSATTSCPPIVSGDAPDFVQNLLSVIMAGKGDLLPVSAFEPGGGFPTATTQWEKRNIALEIPIWDPTVCIQCNKCAMVCPHAAIRSKVYEPALLGDAPEDFQSVDFKAKDFKGEKFTIQVAPEDCTGCSLCVQVCPAKNKSEPKFKAINMQPQRPNREREIKNYDFFLGLPEVDRSRISRMDVKGSQFLQPLFEYSGACTGCGETPYVKLITQLFGDRMLISNATGCSSIYGGNLPTTPYCVDPAGRGPTWSNSLFEDNAEFGFGFRIAIDQHIKQATVLLKTLAGKLGDDLVGALINADQTTHEGIQEQRARVADLKAKLAGDSSAEAKLLNDLADYLVKKSVWAFGGDGWAYDIGFGGLDHTLAQDRDFNILVMDTEVYSNTGGQASKATPIGAAAKFAASGKEIGKKDLGRIAMSYGHIYVASIAMGAKDSQTVQALLEAESYPGPSLIIAYSHCIAHGYDLAYGLNQQKLAVESGIWPLYRFDPRRAAAGEPPLKLDSPPIKASVADYMRNETRFRMVEKMDPERFKALAKKAEEYSAARVNIYSQLADITVGATDDNGNGKTN